MAGDSEPLDDARAFLEAVRRDGETEPVRQRIADWTRGDLTALAEPVRRATWLNVYNGMAQVALTEASDRLTQPVRRQLFFARDRVTIAGHSVSLNDIEHGFLRGRASWGLGYVPRLLAGRFERAVRVPLDPRIHFALNCGAASCPPIEAYSDDVDRELDLATEGYLEEHVVFDHDADTVRIPRLFSWYRGDFGGSDGIRSFLKRFDLLPPAVTPTISYHPYDWSPALGRFRSEDDDGTDEENSDTR